MNIKKLFAILVSLTIMFFVSVFTAQAVTIDLPNPFNCGGVSPCSIFTLLRVVIDNILLPIGGILAVLAFIYSGFLYVTAQGNQSKLDNAHKALLYTSIGTAILLGSWVIAKVIENTINQLR